MDMALRRLEYRSGATRWLGVTLLAASLLGASTASADLAQKRKPERYEVKGSGYTAGAARATVEAPSTVVRTVVTDFGNYQDFITRFKSARIVGKVGDKTDVYLQVPIMKGAVKIWAVVRFEPPKKDGDFEVIVGKMVKGNVKRLDATWRVKRLDDKRSQLTLELAIVPDIPVPDALVGPELRFAAAKAVEGARDEAERRACGASC